MSNIYSSIIWPAKKKDILNIPDTHYKPLQLWKYTNSKKVNSSNKDLIKL